MAYLDPASNPGSNSQRFSVKNFKSFTSDKDQTFKTTSAPAATLGGTFSKRNHWTFQENKNKNKNKNKNQWFEIKWAALMAAWLYPT